MRGPARGDPKVADLPSALPERDSIARKLKDRPAAVFLDYDGTLTPIVEDPARATLPEATRRAIRRLALRCTVALISGRDLDDVRSMVGLDGLAYAGSHGFDVLAPDGSRHQHGGDFLEALDVAERELRPAIEAVPGALLERKRFAIAVHFRQADPLRVPELEEAVDRVAAAVSGLRKTGGKMIFELRPDLNWDKGRAVLSLLDLLGLPEDVVPIYVGDDETDEDAFRAIQPGGIGVIVRGEGDDRVTAASYSLSSPEEVRELLELLANVAK
jgi:trehalose 6-phosphate phosphatase